MLELENVYADAPDALHLLAVQDDILAVRLFVRRVTTAPSNALCSCTRPPTPSLSATPALSPSFAYSHLRRLFPAAAMRPTASSASPWTTA
jgi:hypothetical protein